MRKSSVASAVPFNNTTGKGFLGTDVQAALEELRDHTIYDSRTQATTAGGTVTLTLTDTNLQYLTGTAAGYSMVLPDATTLPLSAYYQIINLSSQNVNVKTSGGAVLFVLSQASVGSMLLQLNGSAAGSWVWWQTSINTASGIISYYVISSANFTFSANVDTLIPTMTIVPQAGTYAVWYNSQNSSLNSGLPLDVTIYNGATAAADSKRTNLSTAGTHIFQSSTQTISQYNGTNACAVYANANAVSMTIVARSMLLIRLGT